MGFVTMQIVASSGKGQLEKSRRPVIFDHTK